MTDILYSEEVFFTVGQKPQSKWISWADSNWVVSQQMNAGQTNGFGCVPHSKYLAFLSVSVHIKCDFAQPTALLTGGFYKVHMAQSLKPTV